MNALTSKSSFKNAAIGLLMLTTGAAMVAAPANDVQAQQPQTVSAKNLQVAEMLISANKKAENFSKQTGGVGIVISYGAYEGAPPPEAIGNKFKSGFENKGIPAQYFIVENGRQGIALSYDVEGIKEGPYNLQQAADNFSRIVSLRKGATNVLASVRTYDH